MFPANWSVEAVSLIARVCSIPYGTCIFEGDVNEIVHPETFYRFVHLKFSESNLLKKMFTKKFEKNIWFESDRVIVTGHPKLDYLSHRDQSYRSEHRLGKRANVKKIMWTPRWRTEEGNCHFFEYKDFLENACKEDERVNFAFRPHPFCFQNFLKTGELTVEELAALRERYAASKNLTIHERHKILL